MRRGFPFSENESAGRVSPEKRFPSEPPTLGNLMSGTPSPRTYSKNLQSEENPDGSLLNFSVFSLDKA